MSISYEELCRSVYLLPPDPEGVDFYVLEYDGGQQTTITVDTKKDKVLEVKNFPNADTRKEYQKKQKAYNLSKNYEFEKYKVEIKTGIGYIGDMYNGVILQFPRLKKEMVEKGWLSLDKLLASCGEDIASRREVWQLVSAVLSGHLMRFLYSNKLMPVGSGENLRAPILHCTRKDGTEDTLIRIMESLTLDTTEPLDKNSEIIQVITPVLPKSLGKRQSEDSAYIQLVDYYNEKKNNFICYDGKAPAQYRDTAVMLRGRFFTPKVVLDFQQRNPWATILLFTVPDSQLLIDPIRLNGNVFANGRMADEWSAEDIIQLVKYFIVWARENWGNSDMRSYITDSFTRYGGWIAAHNHKRGSEKIRGLRQDWILTQLLVSEMLASVIGRQLEWSEEAALAQASVWCNLLLPGCCEIPDTPEAQVIRERVLSPEEDAVNVCREALKAILCEKNLPLIIYVPKGENYSEVNSNALGYLRVYRQNTVKRDVVTLQIREEIFCKYAEKYRHANWALILAEVRKKAPEWLLTPKAVRMPWLESKVEKTLLLDVEALDFLPDSIKDSFWNRMLPK